MKTGLKDYIREAFNARPIGMLVPPNWIGVGLFVVLGLVSPGFLLLGAGLELGYLYVLSTNPRFQRLVDARRSLAVRRQWQRKLERSVSALGEEDRKRYHALEHRCRSILLQQQDDPAHRDALRAESEGLGRLLWIFIKLLFTRQSIRRVLRSSTERGEPAEEGGSRTSGSVDVARDRSLDARIRALETRIEKEDVSDDLRKSLTGQIDILRQRQAKQAEAADKLAFIEAELDRIQQQAELIREQGVLATDPESVSQRIDDISATLGGTTSWILEQQQLYGKVEDLLDEPPSLVVPESMEELQQ